MGYLKEGQHALGLSLGLGATRAVQCFDELWREWWQLGPDPRPELPPRGGHPSTTNDACLWHRSSAHDPCPLQRHSSVPQRLPPNLSLSRRNLKRGNMLPWHDTTQRRDPQLARSPCWRVTPHRVTPHRVAAPIRTGLPDYSGP